MVTKLLLLRHAATEANLANPPLLQGRRLDPPLARLGIRQAEATRDALAAERIDACFCSPLRRAIQTAQIVAQPHRLFPIPLEALTECDIGRWEGMDWQAIRYLDSEAHSKFMSNPVDHGYPGGENFHQVSERVTAAIEQLFQMYRGKTLLVVSHHVVNRVFLSTLIGLPLEQARHVSLDNCGISVVVRNGYETVVETLNAGKHLEDIAA